MSTTHTTRSGGTVSYTVVGGPKGKSCPESMPVSVLLLDRGNRLYRSDTLHELEKLGFSSIVSVEVGTDSMDVEALAGRFPGARFLLLSDATSPGEMVNIGMREACGPYVFVLWSDMRLSIQALSSRFFERLAEKDLLCRSPYLANNAGETLPCASSPAFHGKSLKVLDLVSERDDAKTLRPFDYCGIYSREKYLQLGGFDPLLASPYWQKLDFGFRAWLWGEEIRLAQSLKVSYVDGTPEEDSTPNYCYGRFWLRNLAPRFRSDSAYLPASSFWGHLRSRRGDVFAAFAEFREARDWVTRNRFRFRVDASSVVDLWEESGG
jgi:hypothetical protein